MKKIPLHIIDCQGLSVDLDHVHHIPPQTIEKPPGLQIKKLPSFPKSARVGLVQDYLDLFGPCTEAPDSYHFAVITSILGLYLGREFYINTPNPVYQNYYFMIVGMTALSHKSTALKFGEQVIKAIDKDIKTAHAVTSAEGIFKLLEDNPGTRLLISNDEMKSLLRAAARAGTQNLLPSLCTLYDPPEELIIARKDPQKITRCLVSIISAVTPEGVSDNSEREAVTGGFFNRNILMAGEIKPPISNPQPPDETKRLRFIEKVKEWRRGFPREGVEIIRGAAAMALYDDYYRPWRAEILSSPETTARLRAREADHIQKLAGIFAVLNTRTETDKADIYRAIDVVEHSHVCQSTILKDAELTQWGRRENRILEMVTGNPKTNRDICRALRGTYDQGRTGRAIQDLYKAGALLEWKKRYARGQPTAYYYLPEDQELMDKIIREIEEGGGE